MMKELYYIKSRLIRKGKQAFIYSLPENARVMDVGCGNKSPYKVKIIRKDVYYVGIDIEDYNNTKASINCADEYILTEPEKFSKAITDCNGDFDAIISCHNIEHCYHPYETLSAMCEKLKWGGRLYMEFPCEKSAGFPHRKGTLNFYDDKTHIYLPEYDKIIKIIEENNMRILFSSFRYRPWILFLIGMLEEPISRLRNKTGIGTWFLYGFSSIIWAEKRIKKQGNKNG